MTEIKLNEEDLLALQRCLNEGMEPPPEMAKKLFPSLYTTFDFKTLKDSKIPTIEYAGKRSEAAILNEASAFGGGSPLQLERYFEGGKISKRMSQVELFAESKAGDDNNWRNLIVQGDNLQFLKTCYLNQDPVIKDKVKGKVKLIYIDPPFATKGDFEGDSGEDNYTDKVDRAEFIEGLRERLIYLRELLEDDGSIYVHCDWHMGHIIKLILDEVFSAGLFHNHVTWKRSTPRGNSYRRYPELTDYILFYTKSAEYPWNDQYGEYRPEYIEKYYTYVDEVTGRTFQPTSLLGHAGVNPVYEWRGIKKPWRYPIHRLDELEEKKLLYWPKDNGVPRLKRFLDEQKGVPIQSLWEDIPPVNSQASEDTKYATQKPEALLERIIIASSNPGDLVMDVFAGSGTTAAVAEKLGRRWIVCDFGKHAVYTMQKRMCLIEESLKLGNQGKKKEKYGAAPKPFCVVSVGAFDFQKIMYLRKNRDAYISFVMGIFGLTERDDTLAAKYRINHVCALKEGNPVEIYPVWDDEFLRNVRIDEDYLQGILTQSGGRLKGDYYIIAPETCVRVGETQMKNTQGERVTFKPLTFPYKVLEEVARNFAIEEQPSSSDNINKLISSVGFYFNESVEVEIKKTTNGFKIHRFTTSILDRDEKRYEELEGLAMLLIDSNYDEEKGFTVDTVVYQRDIKDKEVPVSGLTDKAAVIAIDKHGNESGVIQIR